MSLAPTAEGRLRGSSDTPSEEAASAEDFADLGVTNLLASRPGKAVPLLEAAVRRDPANAGCWSDLGAAYLALAAAENNLHELVRGLAATRRALALDPELPEALFNRALALERLWLRPEAAAAWKESLARDSESPWAEEAKARRQALLRPVPAELWEKVRVDLERAAAAGDTASVWRIVIRFPQQARECAEELYLPGWANAHERGHEIEATRHLTAARTVGAVLSGRGESMAADAVAAIDRAFASLGEPGRLAALAEGHLGVKQARLLQIDRKSAAARETLRSAADRLRSGGSPFALWADLYGAVCDFETFELDAARQIVDRLARDPELDRSPSLAGRTAWISGLTRFRRGDPSAALGDYRRALAFFERGGETENIGAAHILLAETFAHLGDEREAWAHRGVALSLLPGTPSPKRRLAVLEEAELAIAAEDPPTALLFREAGVREARRLGDPVSVSFALLRRAVLRHSTRDDEGAALDLEEAAHLVAAIPEEQRLRMEAELALAQGEVVEEKEPSRAAHRYGDALRFFEESGAGIRQLEARFLRFRAERQAGDEEAADADLTAGLAEAERQRSRVDGEELQSEFFARVQPFFDALILSAVQRGEVRQSLDLAERARARTLLDRFDSDRPEPEKGPLPSTLLVRRLPPGVGLVEYAVLEDQLVGWVLRRGGIEMFRVQIPAARLRRQIETLRSAIAGGVDSPTARRLANRLYDSVLQPALLRSSPGEVVILVPDKALNDLPFAVLSDPRTGRYLVQDHAIGVAPGASCWLRALERARAVAAHPVPGALLIGDPAFDPGLFPGLGRLSEARREVEEISRLYPPGSSLTLLGRDASPHRVLQEIDHFGVIQISGHSQINAAEPRLSRLALASAKDDSGVLYARDLEGLRLAGARLVILAACSTGLQGAAGAEGVAGLTRSFLAAGIPAVVASLWNVPDAPGTARLMTELHRHLLLGESPFSALRSAQLSLLADPNPAFHDPRLWAAFEVFGGAVPESLVSSR
jgi:CHAT domain-containing protein/tetratricopeptide (TPR) repeat protein